MASTLDFSTQKLETLTGDEQHINVVDRMYIGGEFVTSADDFETVHPPTGRRLATIPVASESQIDKGISAAHRASETWQELSLHERRRRMDRFADVVDAHGDEIAILDVADNGSVITHFQGEVDSAVDFIRHMSGVATGLNGDVHDMEGGMLNYELREPYGVVGNIVPFNHPAMLLLEKIASVLMAGNGAILKPDERTPLSALYVAKLIDDADLFPDGLVNIVTGGGEVGAYLSSHPDIGVVTLTGGVDTGREVMRAAAENFAEVHLELGGKNPFIVFPDADVQSAIEGSKTGMNFTIEGQSCAAGTLALVHEDIYDEYVSGVVEEFEDINVGDPFVPRSDMGSLVSERQYQNVLEYIAYGKDDGVKVHTGGEPITEFDTGYFITPTILEADPDMRVAREEIFGPVLVMVEWSEYDEVIQIANDLEYGLTASIWTKNIDCAHRTAEQLEAGYVWVNQHGNLYTGTPFGGYKNSGLGSKGTLDELLSYTRTKNVNVALQDVS